MDIRDQSSRNRDWQVLKYFKTMVTRRQPRLRDVGLSYLMTTVTRHRPRIFVTGPWRIISF